MAMKGTRGARRMAPPASPTALALLALLLLSGCAAAPHAASTGTTTAPAAASSGAPLVWKATSKDGNAAAVPGAYPQGVAGMPEQFDVAKGKAVWLNITLAGNVPAEVVVRYVEPGCAASGCTHDVTTTGGAATLRLDGAPDGQWGMGFFASSVPFAGTYHLAINVLSAA